MYLLFIYFTSYFSLKNKILFNANIHVILTLKKKSFYKNIKLNIKILNCELINLNITSLHKLRRQQGRNHTVTKDK